MNARQFLADNGIVLGEGDRENNITMPKRFLEGHTLIMGKSGTGKSNLVSNIVKELDIDASSNIILLDPHGTLLDRIVYANTGRDLIYLSPGVIHENGVDKSVSINMLGLDELGEEEVERTTGWVRDMMAGDESISGGSWGPRLEVIFKVILPELFRQSGRISLIDLANTISGKQEMKKFISNIADGSKKRFIESQYQDWRTWSQYISSTMNRLLPLLSNRATRNLVAGSEDSVDLFNEMSEGGKLIALNISKSSFPDESIKIITSLFLLKIWTGILKGFGKNRRNIDSYIVIDEFQAIPAGVIETFLREGRKFGIKLILSSQFLNDSSRDLRHAVFGNVRNFISFNMHDSDAVEISKMVPDWKDQVHFLETIKGQRLHKAIILSQTEEGLAGPLSFKPYFETAEIDSDILDSIKLQSLKKYVTGIEEEYSKPSERTLHESILDGIEENLSKEGIELRRSVKFGNSIADGAFNYDGREFIVEIEVSDVSSKFRLLSKLTKYGERSLILVSQKDRAKDMHRMIASPTGIRIRDGFALELPLVDGSRKLYARDIARSIPHTLLLEYNEGKLRSYWNGNTRGFMMKHLKEKFTFQRELDNGKYEEVKNYIFKLMKAKEMFAVKKSDLLSDGPIKDNLMEEFLKKNSSKDSDFVLLEDLFS